MEKKSEALLRFLTEMPAAVIYALADKVHLFNGFELCKRLPVSRISWSEDGAILRVKLSDAAEFEVSISLGNGELASSCDCGVWSPRGRCPHIVASLATLKKALAPDAFPMLQLPEQYLAGLRAQLPMVSPPLFETSDAVPAADQPYSLVIDREEGAVRIRLLHDGEEVTPLQATLPASIRDFLRLLYSATLRGRCIEEFLARFGERFPIFYQGADGLLPMSFDAAAERLVLLRLDLRRDGVCVARTLEDGSRLDESSFIGEQYHFDLRRGVIRRIADAGGERYLKRLLSSLDGAADAALADADGIHIAPDSFNRAQFQLTETEFPHFLSLTTLCINGLKVQPRAVQPRYRLDIADFAEQVRLVGEGVATDLRYPLCAESFGFFSGTGRQHLPQPLRAKKRVAAIFKACFATLAGRNRGDREKILRLALNTADFTKRGVKTEARRIINGFSDGLERRTLLKLHDSEWFAVAVDGEKEARLLEIPYQLFGAEIFMESAQVGEMVVERKQLMKNLSRLRTALASAGFTLAMTGEELETVAWSFTLDASRSSIDWFELRPEIRCDGELVDENELREVLKTGGVFRRGGGLVLLDEESSRALAIFETAPKREVVRVPRLQILDWIALRRSAVRVILSPKDEAVIDSLTHFDRIPQREVPEGLNATLRRYQREGYSWLAFLYEHRFGACLADDMGLGKTVQAIALMAGISEGKIGNDLAEPAPHLVVVPPSLIFNWESELSRFCPSLKVGTYRGQGRRADFSGLDLVLTSYGVVQRDIEILGELPFNVIVFDEAQAIKNIHAETTGAVRRLKGRFKLALTGTPVENHLGEYFSVMDLALPGLLGPYEQFRRQMGREGSGFMATLIRRTRPFILRRTKDMIAAELPPKVETDLYLEMSTRQKALYARTVAQVKATVAEAYRGNAPGQARIIALTAILKLRQICLSSKLLLPELSDRSPKIDFLIDQLQELFSEGHSVLVFSQFTSFLDVVQEALAQHGVPFLRLDGTTPVRRRKEIVETFQESPAPSVFLLSLKAGGKGLNLTRASYVFHLDPWWNPAVENQASDRAHRIGQKRQVTITRLLMRHSIEEKMMELKKRKLKLYRALLEDAEHEGGSALGKEDFDFLLG